MAETLLAPVFRTAIGGLSDDIFNGISDSFYSSKNIDIRSGALEIKLNKRLVKDSGSVVNQRINAIIKTSTGKMLAFGYAGGIFRKDGSSWEAVATNTPGTQIYSAIEFNKYVYWATSTKIHRIKVGDLSNNIKSKEIINRQTVDGSDYYPMLVSMGDLFVGHGGKLGRIDVSNVWEDRLTMDSSGTIKILNDLGGSIRVITYSDKGNSNIYLWDGVASAPDQTIPLKGFNVRQSEIFNGYNYLTTNRGLRIFDGYQAYPLKRADGFNDNINSITVHNEKLCIGGKGGVYTYGADNKNYPESLVLDYQVSTGNDDDEVYAIFSDGTDLYVSWKGKVDGTDEYGIDKLSTTVFYEKGELITRGYFANSLKDVKEGIRLIIGFKKLLENEKITISYAVDGGTWEQIGEFNSDTELRDKFTDEILFSSGSFQYIQFKIGFEGDGTTTPVFYGADLVFNNINR